MAATEPPLRCWDDRKGYRGITETALADLGGSRRNHHPRAHNRMGIIECDEPSRSALYRWHSSDSRRDSALRLGTEERRNLLADVLDSSARQEQYRQHDNVRNSAAADDQSSEPWLDLGLPQHEVGHHADDRYEKDDGVPRNGHPFRHLVLATNDVPDGESHPRTDEREWEEVRPQTEYERPERWLCDGYS